VSQNTATYSRRVLTMCVVISCFEMVLWAVSFNNMILLSQVMDVKLEISNTHRLASVETQDLHMIEQQAASDKGRRLQQRHSNNIKPPTVTSGEPIQIDNIAGGRFDNIQGHNHNQTTTAVRKVPSDELISNRSSRVLVGIFSSDSPSGVVCRGRYRALFRLWDDERVCSLSAFRKMPEYHRQKCELIWTFVVGGGGKDIPPENVADERPMIVELPATGESPDWNATDMTLLNIRENMNEGKSQTWLKYAASVARENGFQYVAKCDEDSILRLPDFFQFTRHRLPPSPYNKGFFVGALRDKAFWNLRRSGKALERYEMYFHLNHENVHIYIAGTWRLYSMSKLKRVGTWDISNAPLGYLYLLCRSILHDES
jgi:hypothetical protein